MSSTAFAEAKSSDSPTSVKRDTRMTPVLPFGPFVVSGNEWFRYTQPFFVKLGSSAMPSIPSSSPSKTLIFAMVTDFFVSGFHILIAPARSAMNTRPSAATAISIGSFTVSCHLPSTS